MAMTRELRAVRQSLGARLFGMVAGPEGPANRARIHQTPGPRWFGEDRPIRRVHGDASMFVGGLRALLLQSLHPLAMAGVADHSDYRGDPWGRLQRTSTFLAVTTFGPAADAQRAVDRVRGIHRRVRGIAPTAGPTRRPIRTCSSGCTSPRSTASCSHTSSTGPRRWTSSGRDDYVADTARVATALGVPDPPRTEKELRERIAAYRPELEAPPPPAKPPASCCSLRRCRCPPGRPTRCWPPRRWPCCRPGPGSRCGCRTSRRWRPPRSARPGGCWSAASGGR